MTHQEAKDLLINRVEWENTSTANNSLSGRHFQEEHPAVNLDILSKTIVKVDSTFQDLEKELFKIKEISVQKVLHDVFSDCKIIKPEWFSDYPELFDTALILRATRIVLLKVIYSPRINEVDTIIKNRVNQWFYDLNGLKNKEEGIFTEGYVTKYKREIKRIREVLGINKFKITLVTAR